MIKALLEKWEDFKYFWTYNPFNIRSFCEKVKGTIEYACFVWKSDCYREWDFEYLYDLMVFKLERMSKQLRKDNFVVDSEVRYDEIQEALAYFKVYQNVEDGNYERDNIDLIREMYKQQQDAWCKFHDALKNNAQKWWS